MSNKICLALDLGTTNSAIAIHKNGRTEELTIPGEGPQLQSVVFWPDGENPKIGRSAKRAAFKNPQFLFTHFKRRMYDEPRAPVYGGHTAIELTAEIIRELVKVACKSAPEIQQHLDGTRSREDLIVCLTHPASYGIQQTDALREAGRLAGIKIDYFMPEPVAAGYRLLQEYQHRFKQNDRLGLIDVGDGTTDPNVTQLTQGTLNTVVGVAGDNFLGGADITGPIFVHIAKKLKTPVEECFDALRGLDLAHPSLNSEKKRRLAMEYWEAATDLKLQLSTSEHATAFVAGRSGPEEITLTSAEYDELTVPFWSKYRTIIAGMLGDSGLSFSDIHHIALAGGSAMARGMLQHTAEVTGKPTSEILLSSSASHVVASGAAIACFRNENADAHIGRGLGIRVVSESNGSKRYVNKMIVPTNTIIKSAGEIYRATGQRLHSHGGTSRLRLQFVEAAAGVPVPKPEPGIPSLLDDSEVNRLREVVHDVEVPAGEHEVFVGFSISAGSTNYQIAFENSQLEGVSGRLESESTSDEVEAVQQPIDLAILLDISGSMKGVKLRNATIAIENVVNQTVGSDVRTAVVTFGHKTGLLSPFGTPQADIVKATKSLSAGGGTLMTEAIEIARDELRSQSSGAHKLTILVTDGYPNNPETAEAAATELKSDTELICFGIGESVDEGYLTRMATSPVHYFYTDDPQRIPALFAQILELYLS